jgi:glycosyltransferase involved in cell wall biosynthesis
LNILQISTTNAGGGAALVAGRLARRYRESGVAVRQAVGRKVGNDPGVVPIGNRRSSRWLRRVTGVHALRSYWSGHEDFDFPATYGVLDRLPAPPDVIECHNLHGGYFDLRALPWLSRQAPTVLALHDAWMLSGHCAHSFDCEKWVSGCGACPDLTIEPAIRRDATSRNWHVKQGIYAQSRLYVAAPCEWLARRVQQSMLGAAVVDARVIPNGVDLDVFQPADRHAARAALGIPAHAELLLATTGRHGELWRDHAMLRRALAHVVARRSHRDLRVIVLGGDAPTLTAGIPAISVGYVENPRHVARIFQAADVYVHAARADTFPTTVLEALACGTPVVATQVGGIPEQIADGDNGFVVAPGDDAGMAHAILMLLSDANLHRRLSCAAARDAHERFDVRGQADAYLSWYRTIIGDWEPDAVR